LRANYIVQRDAALTILAIAAKRDCGFVDTDEAIAYQRRRYLRDGYCPHARGEQANNMSDAIDRMSIVHYLSGEAIASPRRRRP